MPCKWYAHLKAQHAHSKNRYCHGLQLFNHTVLLDIILLDCTATKMFNSACSKERLYFIRQRLCNTILFSRAKQILNISIPCLKSLLTAILAIIFWIALVSSCKPSIILPEILKQQENHFAIFTNPELCHSSLRHVIAVMTSKL